jgi:hypothetical protein
MFYDLIDIKSTYILYYKQFKKNLCLQRLVLPDHTRMLDHFLSPEPQGCSRIVTPRPTPLRAIPWPPTRINHCFPHAQPFLHAQPLPSGPS